MDPECGKGYSWSEENEICVQKNVKADDIKIDENTLIGEEADDDDKNRVCPKNTEWSYA